MSQPQEDLSKKIVNLYAKRRSLIGVTEELVPCDSVLGQELIYKNAEVVNIDDVDHYKVYAPKVHPLGTISQDIMQANYDILEAEAERYFIDYYKSNYDYEADQERSQLELDNIMLFETEAKKFSIQKPIHQGNTLIENEYLIYNKIKADFYKKNYSEIHFTHLAVKVLARIKFFKDYLRYILLNSPLNKKSLDGAKKGTKNKRTLSDIWQGDKISYEAIIEKLKTSCSSIDYPFLQEIDGKLFWTKTPKKGFVQYVKAFIIFCIENKYVLNNYSNTEWGNILKNTFNVSFDTGPFKTMTERPKGEYFEPFKSFPSNNNQSIRNN